MKLNVMLVATMKTYFEEYKKKCAKSKQLFDEKKAEGCSNEDLKSLAYDANNDIKVCEEIKKDFVTYKKKFDFISNYDKNSEEYSQLLAEFHKYEDELMTRYEVGKQKTGNKKTDHKQNKSNKASKKGILLGCGGLAVLVALGLHLYPGKKKSDSNDIKSTPTPAMSQEYIPTSPKVQINTTEEKIETPKKNIETIVVFGDSKEEQEAKRIYTEVLNTEVPKISEAEFYDVLDELQVTARSEEFYKNLQELDTKDKQVKNISVEEIERLIKYINNGNVDKIKAADGDKSLLALLSMFDAEIYDTVRAVNGNINESSARKPKLNTMLLTTDKSPVQDNIYKLYMLRQGIIQSPNAQSAKPYIIAMMALAIDTWYVGDPLDVYTIDSYSTSGEKFLYQLYMLQSFALSGNLMKDYDISFIKMHEGKEEICKVNSDELYKKLNCADYVVEGDLADTNEVKQGAKTTETKYWQFNMLKEAIMQQELTRVLK